MSVLPTTRLRRALLATFIAVPLVNYGVFLLPSGRNQFADDAETLVDAAGYGFSIWGLIFLGMLAFSIYQLNRDNGTPALRRAMVFLIVAGLASVLFVPISIYGDQLLGWCDIALHLVALIQANRALRAHLAAQPEDGHWSYFGPSMYLGWISAATVISTALALDQLGLSFPPDTAVVLASVLAAVLTGIGLYLMKERDAVFGLTVAWALIAIAVEQSAQAIVATALGGAALLLVYLAVRLVRRRRLFFGL